MDYHCRRCQKQLALYSMQYILSLIHGLVPQSFFRIYVVIHIDSGLYECVNSSSFCRSSILRMTLSSYDTHLSSTMALHLTREQQRTCIRCNASLLSSLTTTDFWFQVASFITPFYFSILTHAHLVDAWQLLNNTNFPMIPGPCVISTIWPDTPVTMNSYLCYP